MSFSNDITTYPPQWRTILERIGTGKQEQPMLFGPLENAKRTAHTRFRFYHYKKLVAKWPHSTSLMYEGVRRVEVKIKDERWLEFSDRFQAPEFKLFDAKYGESQPATELHTSASELEAALAQAGLPIATGPTVVTESIEEDPNADQGLKRYLGKK